VFLGFGGENGHFLNARLACHSPRDAPFHLMKVTRSLGHPSFNVATLVTIELGRLIFGATLGESRSYFTQKSDQAGLKRSLVCALPRAFTEYARGISTLATILASTFIS
jgi:hypothetical protein